MRALEHVRARVRAMDPFRIDVALAAVFVVAGVIELSLLDPEGNPRGPTIATGVVALSSIAFRRREPLLAAALFVVPVFAQAVAGGYLTTNSTTPFVAVLLLLFSVARYAAGRRFRAAAALLAVGTTATIFVEDGLEPSELFWAVFLFGLPLLAGRALRSRALLQAELRDKADRAEREREERARNAIEDERARIATELQALVANGVSAMVVQAETVPRALAAGDGSRAAAALAAVEYTGRDALTEMRRLLGVLRRDGDGPELAPQPGVARLEALVERVRGRGLDVKLRMEGERRPLSPGVDLTAYRVVEDALDAAAEMEAGSADVLVRYVGDELQLQVSDDREGGASDRLPGLRDRVGLYGGRLRAERLDTGGSARGRGLARDGAATFRLRARLPVKEGF